ncbi:MAG TPA: hypothetical protein PKV66_04710, partial [Candidatus Pelethenecus sp.]|nr:hypothetical protein [Candidatus Pelethenecus sp.]
MFTQNKEVLGNFRKFGAKFSSYDDGKKLTVQINSKSYKYTFDKLKNYYLQKKIITVSSTLNIHMFDYHIVSFYYLNENSFEIYYDYRIEKFSGNKCYSIRINSKDIDVFSQNSSFLNNFISGLKNKNFDISKDDHEVSFEINHSKYKLSIFNSIFAPGFMECNVSFKSFLVVSSEKELDFLELIKLFNYIKTLIAFCTHRKNIDFDYVELFDKYNPELADVELPFGEMYVPYFDHVHTFNNYNENPMIRIDSLVNIIGNLFDAIDKSVFDTIYIPNETDSFNSNFVNSTAWLQSFFRVWAAQNTRFKVKKINVEDTQIKNKSGNNSIVSFQSMIDFLMDYCKDYMADAFDKLVVFFKYFNNMYTFNQ